MDDTSSGDQARYDYLIRSSSDGVLIADKHLVLLQMNPAAAAMLGLTIDEVVGRPAEVVFAKHVALLQLFTRPGEHKLDVRLPRQRLAQGIADTLSNGERIILLTDITEKRDLEARREALVRAIAHDLSNPVGAIRGYADLVARVGELNEQQRKFNLRVQQTAAKIHEVLRTLVDLAWIEAGMPLRHAPFHLDEVIKISINKLEDLARKQQIGIVTSLQAPLPTIMGDPERMQLAIFHILQNAILYNRPEKNIVVHAWGDEHEAYCSIADQGIGIADQELDLIFDRMYRSKDERISDISGGGLGLTIARTIIKRHGGDIWANSTLNVGTTVTFVLPLIRA